MSHVLAGLPLAGLVASISLTSAAWAADEMPVTILAQADAPATPIDPAAPAATSSTPQDAPEAEVPMGDEELVVTGSRVKRSTFTSAAPLQIIDGETSRKLGRTSTADVIQQSNVANGLQINSTISGGFVTSSGPGSSTISLRNLDESRTLVLINGRRLAPAGVEGSPVAANLNLIPSALIERTEILLDGASSVYGSDAVAGVVNVILRKNFNGAEVSVSSDYPTSAGGSGQTTDVSAIWGRSDDKLSILVGGEYRVQDVLSFRDRGYSNQCPGGGLNREYDVATGEFFSFDPRNTVCRSPYLVGSEDFTGLYYTPGKSNTIDFYGVEIPNFSVPQRTGPNPGDQAVNNFDEIHSRYEDKRDADLIPGIKTASAYVTGSYVVDSSTNTEVYTELSYSRQDQHFQGGLSQVFSFDGVNDVMPATNPFNPLGDAFFGPGNGQPAAAVFSIKGERQQSRVLLRQYRAVAGVKGDMPFMDNIGLSNWTYDASVAYTKSVGDSSLQGINAERLQLSLDTTAEISPGVYGCGSAVDPTLPNCVVINTFSDAILGHGILTPEERAYLYDTRSFHTTTEQLIFNAYATGDLFELPGGAAQGVIGVEYRDDRLNSVPNEVARDGLLFGYSSDEGTTGSAHIFEAFVEGDLPILKDKFLADTLELNLSARWSDQQFYGSAWTYSTKLLYKPFEWITVRGTYGTSFRAPNLGEFFKRSQTGFIDGNTDPCTVPAGARTPNPDGTFSYDPTLDERDSTVLNNCRADGLDPTSLGLQGVGSIEASTGGSKDLEAETSRAYSAGVVLSQPWFDDVDLRVGVTYYDIEVQNSISTPSASFIFDNCYAEETQGPFCSRISRIASGPNAGLTDIVDTSYLNIGLIETRGMDYNIFYGQTFNIEGETFKVSIDASASQTFEINYTTFGQLEAYKGTVGSPEWRGSIDGQVEYKQFSLLWSARFIGRQSEEEANANQTCPYINPPPSTAKDPDCTGGISRLSKAYAEAYWVHDVSLTYEMDAYDFTFGVRNIFNRDPIFLDFDGQGDATINDAGVPLGVGYDMLGRTLFARVNARF